MCLLMFKLIVQLYGVLSMIADSAFVILICSSHVAQASECVIFGDVSVEMFKTVLR